jgi:hypothetical protein
LKEPTAEAWYESASVRTSAHLTTPIGLRLTS